MASITIHSSSTIFPSRPTPNGVLQLSASDQMMGMAHYPSVYIYKASDASSLAFDSLRNSLSEVLVPFYPLAGRLRWIDGSRVELDCCAAGVHFIEASSNCKLDYYGDFTPSKELLELAPKVDYSRPIQELPLLYVQVTKFSCGGICINTCISHTASDGSSGMTFISTWASIARGEKTIDTILKPYHQRDFLKPRKKIDSPRFHHQEFEMPPIMVGQSDVEEELSKKEWTNALLKLSKDQIEKLKERVNKGNSETTTRSMEITDELRQRPYTRYESIVGHIWMCASKARSTGESSQPTMVSIAVDLRQRLRPPLPKGFFGNATLVTVTPTCEFGDLIAKPLSYAADKIRQATSKCTDDYLESALDFLASQEDMGWMRPQFQSIGCCETPLLGNPNLDVGSWIWMPLYDSDFGWGRPYYAGPMNMINEGETYILPSPTNDGSLVVVIRLQTNHMNDFKKHFYENL